MSNETAISSVGHPMAYDMGVGSFNTTEHRSHVDNAILSDSDFKSLGKIGVNQDKELYELLASRTKWVVTERFDSKEANSFIAAKLYQLILGDKRVPNMQIIQKADGRYFLGSEFLPDFFSIDELLIKYADEYFVPQNDADLQHLSEELQDGLKNKRDDNQRLELRKNILRCLPYACTPDASSTSIREEIVGFEELVAAMVILNEMDGHNGNVGLVPDPNVPGQYMMAKVDHDHSLLSYAPLSFHDTHQATNLCALIKGIVPDRRQPHLLPDNLNLSRLSQAFEQIDAIPDNKWNETIKLAIQQLKNKDLFSIEHEKLMTLLAVRKAHAKQYALGLKLEAMIRSGDLAELEQLIKQENIDINQRFFTLHVPKSDRDIFTLLEIAVFYGKVQIAKWLNSQGVNAETLSRAAKAAMQVNHMSLFLHFLPQTTLSHEEILQYAIDHDSVVLLEYVEKVTGVKWVDDFDRRFDFVMEHGKVAIAEKLLRETHLSQDVLLDHIFDILDKYEKYEISDGQKKFRGLALLCELYIQDELSARKVADRIGSLYRGPDITFAKVMRKAINFIEDTDFLSALLTQEKPRGCPEKMLVHELVNAKLQKKGVTPPQLNSYLLTTLEHCRRYA